MKMMTTAFYPVIRAAGARAVEILWMIGANPVENLITKKFLRSDPAGSCRAADVDDAFAIPFA